MKEMQCRIMKEDVNKLPRVLFTDLHLCQWPMKGKNEKCTLRNNYLFNNNCCFELKTQKVFIFHIVPICVVKVCYNSNMMTPSEVELSDNFSTKHSVQ